LSRKAFFNFDYFSEQNFNSIFTIHNVVLGDNCLEKLSLTLIISQSKIQIQTPTELNVVSGIRAFVMSS